jgi:membrane peptidoglycan carboxypeptidase
LPGPYWQDQDEAGYSGRRGAHSRPSREATPWDGGEGGFWRDEKRPRRGQGSPGHRAPDGDAAWPEMLAGRSPRPRPDWDDDRSASRGGRFSQTADDLRNRLGMRGSVVSRDRANGRGQRPADADDDFWTEPGGRRDAGKGRRAAGRGNGTRAAGNGNGTRVAGSRIRAASNASTAAGNGGGYPGPGPATESYRDGEGRTALREPDFWEGDGVRRRIAERTQSWRSRTGGTGGGRGGWDGGGPGGWDDDGTPRSRGERFRHWLWHGRWWRHWTWRKALAVVGGGIAAFILLGIAGFFIMYALTPIPTDVSETALWQSSNVYFSNGQLLGTFSNGGAQRVLLTSNQIPNVMDQAMAAAEDRNFYTDDGVSVKGLLRAAYDDVTGSTANLQGGSTITMQYAKQHYTELSSIATSQSVTYKIKEIMVALKIAHTKSASWIMTQYLNTVDFGGNAYGVGAAAEQYFNVNLTARHATLTVPEAAMLAAMPNAPSDFSPNPSAGAGYSALVDRWEYVVQGMRIDGAISPAEENAVCGACNWQDTAQLPQAEKDFSKEIKISSKSQNLGFSGSRYYLMTMVQAELEHDYHLTQTQINTDGLKITTTFSPSMMAGLTRSVNYEESQMKALGQALPSWAHVGAALIDPSTGGIVAIYGGPGVSLSEKACDQVYCWDNTAEIPHQPGSSFKPYVLATAISQGMNAQTSILDGYSPICVPPAGNAAYAMQLSQSISVSACTAKEGQGYWPATDTSYGAISPAEAAAVSSNTAFEDLAHRVGVYNVISTAKTFGVGSTPWFSFDGENDLTSENKTFGPNGTNAASVTITLGAAGADLTAIEQASTFATLADDGIYHTPHVIESVSGDNRSWPGPVVKTYQALNAQQAADEDYTLSFDNTPTYASEGATGYPQAAWDRPVIGKTGTTNTAQDAWFIGAIPQYSLAVTLYTNQQNSVSTPGAETLNILPSLAGAFNTGGYGGVWPAAIWDRFMTTQFANLPVDQLATTNFAYPFSKWVQVTPPKPKKHTCKAGQFQNCVCPGGSNGQCNPNPTPTCNPFDFGCNPTPTTSPTCAPFVNCNPNPTPSPSTSTSCPTGDPFCNDTTDASNARRSSADAAAAAASVTAADKRSVSGVSAARLTAG